jgi:cyclopropane fatty-acyl-phospholipid synthase-like methyltransferase
MVSSAMGSVDARSFYDDYVARQEKVGVNARHHSIMGWLRRSGLRPGHRVLEIGCGVGTLTELLAEDLEPGGSIVALDFSLKSIEGARERLARFNHVRLVVGDVLDVELDGRFDVVVLPDVIEHIPIEQHSKLFGQVASWVRPKGFVLLHYPNPYHLEWCREHSPEVLQIIDQPIYADALVGNVYPHGLYLDSLQTYTIWVREGDYVAAVLKPRAGTGTFTRLPAESPSLLTRIRRRVRRVVDERRP